MLSRPLAIVSGSFLLSLSVLSYYFLRKRNRVAGIAEVKRAQVVDSKASKSSTPFVFQKENLSRESTEKLNNLLNSSDADVRYQALVTIQQATAFTANFAALRDSACLESMLSLLTTDDVSKLTNRQNLCILQILTNMVCDVSCLEVVKKHIDKIVNFACIREYSDVVCAALQVLGNVALTHTGCRVLDCKLPHLMNMLEASDPYILRQVLAVLVNLSCDTESCYLILTSEISDAFVRRMSDTLTPSTQPMVLLQLVNLLKNLYKMSTSMGDDPKPCTDVMTTRDFLLNSKVAIKVRVQFILAEPSIADIHKELVQQAQSLLSLLNGPTVQKV